MKHVCPCPSPRVCPGTPFSVTRDNSISTVQYSGVVPHCGLPQRSDDNTVTECIRCPYGLHVAMQYVRKCQKDMKDPHGKKNRYKEDVKKITGLTRVWVDSLVSAYVRYASNMQY